MSGVFYATNLVILVHFLNHAGTVQNHYFNPLLEFAHKYHYRIPVATFRADEFSRRLKL